jgi:hypothetical protein
LFKYPRSLIVSWLGNLGAQRLKMNRVSAIGL